MTFDLKSLPYLVSTSFGWSFCPETERVIRRKKVSTVPSVPWYNLGVRYYFSSFCQLYIWQKTRRNWGLWAPQICIPNKYMRISLNLFSFLHKRRQILLPTQVAATNTGKYIVLHEMARKQLQSHYDFSLVLSRMLFLFFYFFSFTFRILL